MQSSDNKKNYNDDQALEHIQERLNKLKSSKSTLPEDNPLSLLNISIELVAAVIVGLVVGLYFDNLFASRPISIIICLTLAIIAAGKVIWAKYASSKLSINN